MPVFNDPDIDPALTAEAQSVVEEASKSMMSWLNTSFENIEKAIGEELTQEEARIAEDRLKLQEEDAKQNKEIEDLLNKISMETQYLSPLDEDNRAVINSLNEISGKVRAELEERSRRWQNYGTAAVKSAHKIIKTAVGTIV